MTSTGLELVLLGDMRYALSGDLVPGLSLPFMIAYSAIAALVASAVAHVQRRPFLLERVEGSEVVSYLFCPTVY